MAGFVTRGGATKPIPAKTSEGPALASGDRQLSPARRAVGQAPSLPPWSAQNNQNQKAVPARTACPSRRRQP